MSNVCPHCDGPLEVIVRKPGGTSKQVRRFAFQIPRLFGGQMDQVVSPITQPVINVQSPPAVPGAPLNPGERTYRPLDIQSDVRAVWALVWRAALPWGGVALAIGGWVKQNTWWPGWLAIIVILSAAGVLYIIVNRDVFKEGLVGQRFTTRERDPEQPVTDNAIDKRHLVTLHIDDGKGGHRFLNDINVTPQLKEFARRVLIESVTFSETGAQECDLDKPDFIHLRDQMLDRQLIGWKNTRNKRSGYKWRGGRDALKTLSEFPLPTD